MKKIFCSFILTFAFTALSAFASENPINAVNMEVREQPQNVKSSNDEFQNSKFRTTCFVNAIIKGDIRLVESFINLGFDVNTKSASVPVIFLAVQEKQNEILELMLANGADPNTTYLSEPVAMFAVLRQNIEALHLLLKYGAKVNSDVDGDSLLREAIRKKNPEMVQLLLNYKADVNKTTYGKTPLNYAIEQKRSDIVEILLKAGAVPDSQTQKLLKKSNAVQMKLLFEQNNVTDLH